MNNVYYGAEAIVEIRDDTNKVIKRRIMKKYRHRKLDEKLRIERTKTEVRILKRLSELGLRVPKVLYYDTYTIEMEKVHGKPLIELEEINEEIINKLAEMIAIMHNNNIIHGDLTLRNILITLRGELYLIDFGLSYISSRYEDKAMDVYVLEETTKNNTFINIFYNTYFSKVLYSDHIKNRLEKIRKRRRYLGGT